MNVEISAAEKLFLDAALAYCAAVELQEEPEGRYRDVVRARDAMFAAHRATTPSQTPPTHVVVVVDELESLRAIADAAGEYVLVERLTGHDARPGSAMHNLVAAVDGWKS